MDVLDEILHTWICDVYHQTKNRNTLRTPASLWRDLIDPAKQRLPASAEELDVSVASVETRVLHHYGIELNNLKYNSPELMNLRRRIGEIIVKVRWDRSDLGEIHVLDESANRYLKVPCTWYGYASGVSLWLHKAIRSEAEKSDGEESETKLDAAKARLREICQKAMTSKKLSTRKSAARAEEGLEPDVQPPKPAPPIPSIAKSSTKTKQTSEGSGRPVWEDDDDDDEIPEFVTIHRPEVQEPVEDHEEEESL